MPSRDPLIVRVQHYLHHRFLWVLVGGFAAAALFPRAGLWLRQVSLGQIEWCEQQVSVTLSSLLLALLLFNAGLGVKAEHLRGLLRQPWILLGGLLANFAMPVGFIFVLSQALCFFEDTQSHRGIVVGFALLASLPVAASSAVWSQKAGGDLALSLGLVVGSTCLSPVLTPASLHLIDWTTSNLATDELALLAGASTSIFLFIFVMFPSGVGICLRPGIGEKRLRQAKPWLQVLALADLLLLSYSNASSVLPKLLSRPDWNFVGVVLVASVVLCVGAFICGWLVAALLGANTAGKRSMMFGLGMNNNGTGLVLASTTLSHLPGALLPVIVYTLVQHLVAGVADRWSLNKPVGEVTPATDPRIWHPHQALAARGTLKGPHGMGAGAVPGVRSAPG